MIEPFTFIISNHLMCIEEDDEKNNRLDVSEIYTHKNIWFD